MQRKSYALALEEHYASIKIQSLWRGFWLFSNYIITLDSIIVSQSVIRCHLARRDLRNKTANATIIQAKQRSINARKIASAKSMVKALFSASSAIVGAEVDAALVIQTNYRGYAARSAYFLDRQALVIQKNWRGVMPRRALHHYKSSVRIQTCWRRYFLCTAYTQYRSSKKLQTLWRGYIVRSRYQSFLGARKIQTAWRMVAARSAYTRYQGAKKIQTSWRCYSAREKYVQWLVTVEAATMIQSAWRSFVCYTDFIFTLADIVTVQRCVRGYNHRKIYARKYEQRQIKLAEEERRRAAAVNIQRVYRGHMQRVVYTRLKSAIDIQKTFRGHTQRVAYTRLISAIAIQRVFRGEQARSEVALIKLYLAERKREEDAAVSIQSKWRSYDLKQRYWYLLGCTIQIQCLVRGIVARRRFAEEYRDVVLVQSIARRWFAIRNFKQIRLIDFLLKAAKRDETEKDDAAKTLQLWYEVWIKPRPMIRATIKIQSFFRMVRAMVDREVRAEKQRRRLRKKAKHSRAKAASCVDESVLDSAWDTISVLGEQPTKAKANDELTAAGLLDRAASGDRQGRQDDSCVRNITLSKSRDSTTVVKSLAPPPYYDEEEGFADYDMTPARMVRLGRIIDDSDALSEVSGLTAPTVYRPAPSRLENMAENEMAADLSLEEAWVDMEIQNVKIKQKSMAKGRKHRWSNIKANLNS